MSEESLARLAQQDTASVMSFNSSNNSTTTLITRQQLYSILGSVSEESLARLAQQDTASVMSFNSSNNSTTTRHISHHQLGTKVEMVYSLLSMLGTHDKDDMSRTLLAMSSSQDSCIAMRQSGEDVIIHLNISKLSPKNLSYNFYFIVLVYLGRHKPWVVIKICQEFPSFQTKDKTVTLFLQTNSWFTHWKGNFLPCIAMI